jgi:hypothetical protein
MTKPMIQLIPIMKIISNTCNTMFFCNYVLFIYFASISNTSNNMSCLFFLIAGDWTKMVGNRANRNVNSVYQRARTVDPDASEGVSDGRRRSRFSGRRRQQSPPPRRVRRCQRSTWWSQTRPRRRTRRERGRTRRELIPLPLVHRVSTCEVPRASLRFRFLTDAHWITLRGISK